VATHLARSRGCAQQAVILVDSRVSGPEMPSAEYLNPTSQSSYRFDIKNLRYEHGSAISVSDCDACKGDHANVELHSRNLRRKRLDRPYKRVLSHITSYSDMGSLIGEPLDLNGHRGAAQNAFYKRVVSRFVAEDILGGQVRRRPKIEPPTGNLCAWPCAIQEFPYNIHTGAGRNTNARSVGAFTLPPSQ
jgi:hypothetical protein